MNFDSFEDIKKASESGESLENLKSEVDKLQKKESYKDERIYSLETDKTGNGYAIMRFLPTPPGENEKSPFVRVYNHGFKGPSGKWYIEKCPTTIGRDCPVCEDNSRLWKEWEEKGNKQAQDIVRGNSDEGIKGRKRNVNFYSNVYIIKDEQNSDKEGKVFLFKYGIKIFEKIKSIMQPDVPVQPKINPFDLWKGSDFNMIIKKKGKYSNFDDSFFNQVTSPLLEGDNDKLEKVWKQCYPLEEFVKDESFLAYDVLKEKFEKTVNPKGGSAKKKESAPASSMNENETEVEDLLNKNDKSDEDDFDLDDLLKDDDEMAV